MKEIIFVLDASGSMSGFEDDTIGGFNSFIEKQKENKENTNVSLILFNNFYKPIFKSLPIEEIQPISYNTYMVGGQTALIDAIGTTIDEMGELFNVRENKPDKVIMCITTDGKENASKEYKKEQIKEKIEHQQNKYGWDFIFFGANIDSFAEGSSLGINKKNIVNYDYNSIGTRSVYSSLAMFASDAAEDKSMEDIYEETKKQKM